MGRYIIWCEELGQYESDGQKCTAMDAREAAEEWAEWSDRNSAEYAIVGGAHRKAMVHDLDSGKTSEWILTGESVPQYRAQLVVSPTASPDSQG